MAADSLPPRVEIPLDAAVRELWMERAAQHTQDTYAGVTISKFPEDLRVYEHLLWESRANCVIEIGAHYGGSTLWFRDRLMTNAAYGRIRDPQVISIELAPEAAREAIAGAGALAGEHITLLEADVRDPDLPARVAELIPAGARCLVVEDSAHVYDTTRAALDGFARFVPAGGYFVVEDGCVDVEELRLIPEWPRGVLPALNDWLSTAAAEDFVVRRDMELYGITCHPGGFLQRRPDTEPVSVRDVGDGSRPSLAEELEAAPAWMYSWDLGGGLQTPVLVPELPSIHRTRAELAEPAVREALQAANAAGGTATALDIACNEGWFSHRLLDWGADRVLGIDIRDQNIRRAKLVRDHLSIPAERLDFTEADAFDFDPAERGQFDVVLLLGLIYHVEDPVGLIRRARQLTRRLCVIETQLTRLDVPVLHGWGSSNEYLEASGSFALRREFDAEENLLASAPGIVSLIPNRDALTEMTQAAGFSRIEYPIPHADHNLQYRLGDRAVALAWV